MKEWDPRSVWEALRKTFRTWTDHDDDERQTIDASLLFHLMITVPLLLAFVAMARR